MVEGKKTIRVGAFDYEFVRRLFDEGEDARGYFSAKKLKIEVNKGVPEQQQFEVLFHEVLHAIFEQLNINIEQDEKFIDKVAPVLSRFISDNKIIIKEMW